jgi:hypothetical protein
LEILDIVDGAIFNPLGLFGVEALAYVVVLCACVLAFTQCAYIAAKFCEHLARDRAASVIQAHARGCCARMALHQKRTRWVLWEANNPVYTRVLAIAFRNNVLMPFKITGMIVENKEILHDWWLNPCAKHFDEEISERLPMAAAVLEQHMRHKFVASHGAMNATDLQEAFVAHQWDSHRLERAKNLAAWHSPLEPSSTEGATNSQAHTRGHQACAELPKADQSVWPTMEDGASSSSPSIPKAGRSTTFSASATKVARCPSLACAMVACVVSVCLITTMCSTMVLLRHVSCMHARNMTSEGITNSANVYLFRNPGDHRRAFSR